MAKERVVWEEVMHLMYSNMMEKTVGSTTTTTTTTLKNFLEVLAAY